MPERTLFDFADPAAARPWRSIDDVVMGGVSASRFGPVSDGCARFAGVVSLENGGGFASVRCAGVPLELAGCDALELELAGDGKTYKLALRLDEGFDGVSYQASFRAPAGRRVRVRIAFAELVPTFRGRTVRAEPFDPARATQLGLLIGDRQAGPFQLDLFAIRAVRSG
jgi:hypothetical protein